MSKLPDSLAEALTAFLNTKSYQALWMIKNDKLIISTGQDVIVYETFVAPNRSKQNVAQEADGSYTYVHYIIIGSTGYFSLNNTTWSKIPQGNNTSQNGADFLDLKDIFSSIASWAKSPSNLAQHHFIELPDDITFNKQVGTVYTSDQGRVRKGTIKYDKKTNLLLRFEVEEGLSTGGIQSASVALSNYDKPYNKVDAPL